MIWHLHLSLTIQCKALSVTTDVEVSNTGTQITDNTLYMIIVEFAPWYIKLFYTAQKKEQIHTALVKHSDGMNNISAK